MGIESRTTAAIIDDYNRQHYHSRRAHSRFYVYYSTMGYLFQIVRDIDPKLRILIDTLTLIGLVTVARFAYHFASNAWIGFRTHIWSRFARQDDFRRRYGAWAIVTGCTDGVGLEYARQFAARGLSLVLIGRDSAKLANVCDELQRKQDDCRADKNRDRIEIVTITADLNSDDPQMYNRVMREIDPDRRDIGILVNNAGVMYDSPNRFLDQPESKIWQHVRVNMLAVVMMTRIVLPAMVKRRRGLVINMSSQAAYQPLPLMGLYSASKVFVEWFSRTLEYEYRQYNIEVQTLVPNYISTKMTAWGDIMQRPSVTFPDSRRFTANAIATIGRNQHTCGYWFHDMQRFFTNLLLPNWAYRRVAWYFLQHVDNTKCA